MVAPQPPSIAPHTSRGTKNKKMTTNHPPTPLRSLRPAKTAASAK